MDELDGFLNGDDVAGVGAIDVIDDAGQCGGFSGAAGTGDQDKTGAEVAEVFDDGGQAEFFDGEDAGGDEPEDGADAVEVAVIVAAKTGLFIHLVGEIEVAGFGEFLPRLGAADFGEELLDLFMVERLVTHGGHFPVTTEFGGLALGEVEVGAALVHKSVKELIDTIGHGAWWGYWVRPASAAAMTFLFSARS